MILRGTVRDPKTGAPVPDGTPVEVRRRDDNSIIASLTTSGGAYEYLTDGNPGQFNVSATDGSEVKITSSWAVGPAGAADVSGLPLYFRLWTDGYIPGLWGELAVTADGTGLNVKVANGAAVVRGILYDQRVSNPKTLAIAAADPTNPRIDTVVVRVIPAGVNPNTEGTSLLAVKTGAPAASPVAPTLTQNDSTVWEIALADVRVDAGVTAIAADKVTNRRVQATPGIGLEQVDDRVAALIVAGAGITKTYDDPGNTLTLATDMEAIQDMIAAFLLAGAGIIKTYDDTGNKLTFAALPAPKEGSAISGTVTLSANGGPFTTQTIALDSARTWRVKLEAHCRAYGDQGVYGLGNLYCTIGGVNGTDSPPLQYDQGVDSTGYAVQIRDLPAGTASATLSWGWHHTSGVLTVRGTTLVWKIEAIA